VQQTAENKRIGAVGVDRNRDKGIVFGINYALSLAVKGANQAGM
jgi:hypothetical protein